MPGAVQEIDFSAGLGDWRLYRASPDADLAGAVIEYWEVIGELRPFRETLLPNGYAEVMINLGPPHRVLSARGAGTWTRGWFSGLQEQAIAIESLAGTHLVSARLHPVGAIALLGPRVAAGVNDIVDLDTFCGEKGEALRSAVAAAPTPADRFAVLENFLRSERAATHPADAVPEIVRAAAEKIESEDGRVRVAQLHEAIDVSRKHLAVTFEHTVGLSLKAYAKIRRFVATLARIQAADAVSWSELALDAGYSDQSHLIRDFQRVGAATPTEYLRRKAPDGSALLYESVDERR